MRRPPRDSVGPGQESVWDYPRPPRREPVAEALRVELGGETIARTSRGHRVLETSHPPTYYFPAEDVAAFVGPLVMTVLLLRVSGVPLLERSIAQRRPAYGDYVRRTSRFVPRPPRRS